MTRLSPSITPLIRAVALAAALSTVLGVGAAAGKVERFKAGVWGGWASFGDDNQFRFCSLFQKFPNQVVLFFTLSNDRTFGITFLSEQWQLEQGTRQTVGLEIDKRWSGKVDAVALGPQILLASFPLDAEIRSHLRAGHVLHLVGARQRYDFPLRDTAKALPRLQQCFDANMK